MDPAKRAATRLRRLQHALAPQTAGREAFLAYLKAPFFVRPLATGPGSLSLRKLIDDTVVAFVPPNMPLSDTRVTCPQALVEFTKSGQRLQNWLLNARVETSGHDTVVFVIGFLTNLSGYFAGLMGALNLEGVTIEGVSPSSAVTLSISGYSQWIHDNYAAAVAEGLTIGIHSTGDPNAHPRDVVLDWAGQFNRRLYRPLSRWDTDRDNDLAWGVPAMGSGSLLDEVAEDRSGLSFEVSLRFE